MINLCRDRRLHLLRAGLEGRGGPEAAAALTASGYEVWFDADLPPNRAYADVISEELEAAKAVLVLWRAAAAQLGVGAAGGGFRPRAPQAGPGPSLDGALPPLPFNQIHCETLASWSGKTPPAAWSKVAAAVEGLVRGPAAAAAALLHRRHRQVARETACAGLALAVVAILVAGGAAMWLAWGRLPWAWPALARLAIAQFRVDSFDSQQAKFFADGLADDIQSALNANQPPVVSRADAEALSGPGAQQKIDQLGVRLLFDGAVEQNGQALSVTVDLEDPRNHVTVWSSRIDGDAAKGDALRVHVAALIVAVLDCAAWQTTPALAPTTPRR